MKMMFFNSFIPANNRIFMCKFLEVNSTCYPEFQ